MIVKLVAKHQTFETHHSICPINHVLGSGLWSLKFKGALYLHMKDKYPLYQDTIYVQNYAPINTYSGLTLGDIHAMIDNRTQHAYTVRFVQ